MFNPYYPVTAPTTPQMPFNQVPSNVTTPAQNAAPAVLYAPTARDFQNVTLQPGRQAIVIAQNEPYMAFKVSDYMGMVKTSVYRIEAVTDDELNGKSTEYATKAELESLQGIVQQILENMTTKKTSTRKVEE